VTPRAGQQHAVAHAGHLLAERLQAVARDVQDFLEPLLVLAHARASSMSWHRRPSCA